MKKFIWTLIFILVMPVAKSTAAEEVSQIIDDVASKLVQQLPMDQKIALKTLSPEETGLP